MYLVPNPECESPGVSVDLFMCSRDTGLSRETNAVEHHTVNPMNPMNYWEFGIVVKKHGV